MSKYDINDNYWRERMLRHCPIEICDTTANQIIYINAVEAYARYDTLIIQCQEARNARNEKRAAALEKLSTAYLNRAHGMIDSLIILCGSELGGPLYSAVSDDGHELYLDQWQFGTFRAA